IYGDLSRRNCSLTFFSCSKEERPRHSAKKLLELFLQNSGTSAAATLKIETENAWVEAFLNESEKEYKKNRRISAILIDDVNQFDSISFSWLSRLLRQLQSHPLLLILTSRTETFNLPEPVVSLSIHATPMNSFLESYHIPLWKENQRRLYFEQIYHRTSGNPLLFEEYLQEALRQRHSTIQWEEREWAFALNEIPNLPDALLDFYMKWTPALTEEESILLQKASVQGEQFDPELIEDDAQRRDLLLQSLVTKGMLAESKNGFY